MKKSVLLLLTAAGSLAACRKSRPSPQVMMVPSHEEQSPAPAASTAAPLPAAGGLVSVAGISFLPPKGWRAEAPSSSMRVAQFSIPGKSGAGPASLVVYYFGKNQGGSPAENVARWEGQFTDPAGQKARGSVAKITRNGLEITTVTAAGTYDAGIPMGGASTPEPNSALWGAIVSGPEGNVFLKVTGPRPTVSASEKDFEELLSTIRPSSTSM